MDDPARLTIRYDPSQTSRPIFASSPAAASQTTSPALRRCITPARFSSASHSRTLASDSQSPSGDGTNTCNNGARRRRKSGEWKEFTGRQVGGALPRGDGDGARLGARDVFRLVWDDHFDGYRCCDDDDSVRVRVPVIEMGEGGSIAAMRALCAASASACARRRRTTRVKARHENVSSCMTRASTDALFLTQLVAIAL